MKIEIQNDTVKVILQAELDDEIEFTLSRKDWSQFYSVAKAVFGVPRATGSSEGFEKFWAIYPKKVAKGSAESAWRSGNCSDSIDAILAAVESASMSATWTKDSGLFVPHATTWVRQRRWEDEPTPDATEGAI